MADTPLKELTLEKLTICPGYGQGYIQPSITTFDAHEQVIGRFPREEG